MSGAGGNSARSLFQQIEAVTTRLYNWKSIYLHPRVSEVRGKIVVYDDFGRQNVPGYAQFAWLGAAPKVNLVARCRCDGQYARGECLYESTIEIRNSLGNMFNDAYEAFRRLGYERRFMMSDKYVSYATYYSAYGCKPWVSYACTCLYMIAHMYIVVRCCRFARLGPVTWLGDNSVLARYTINYTLMPDCCAWTGN